MACFSHTIPSICAMFFIQLSCQKLDNTTVIFLLNMNLEPRDTQPACRVVNNNNYNVILFIYLVQKLKNKNINWCLYQIGKHQDKPQLDKWTKHDRYVVHFLFIIYNIIYVVYIHTLYYHINLSCWVEPVKYKLEGTEIYWAKFNILCNIVLQFVYFPNCGK